METSQAIVLGMGGVAIIGVMAYVFRHQSGTSAPAQQTAPAPAATPAPYTPVINTYQPAPMASQAVAAPQTISNASIPVGIVMQGQPDYSPPGVNPAALEVSRTPNLSSTQPVNPVVTTNADHGAAGNLAKTTGVAAAPTHTLPTIAPVKPNPAAPIVQKPTQAPTKAPSQPPSTPPKQVIPAAPNVTPVNTNPANIKPVLTGVAAAIDYAYLALFGRNAEQAGIDYWKGRIDSGTLTISDLPKALTAGARGTDIAAEVVRQPDIFIAYRGL